VKRSQNNLFFSTFEEHLKM